MDSCFADRIEALAYRFDHAISEADILRWLSNFKEKQWSIALEILENVIYYSSDRIFQTLQTYLLEILKKYHHVRVLPIGNVGKSGNVMAYYAKKILENLKISEKELRLITTKELGSTFPKRKDCCLVLLDDFSGSGETVLKFFNEVQPLVKVKRVQYVALTVASMQLAKDKLQKDNNIVLYGDIYDKCFSKARSVFGRGDRLKVFRQFCFDYGKILFPDWQHQDLKPLGYKNSQAMIAFEHTTPNNSLPILWYEDVRNDNGEMWKSIFPRFANSRIERSKRFRHESYYWLHRLRREIPSLGNSINVPDRDVLQLLNVMRLKGKRHGEAYICQALNLSYGELNSILDFGKTHLLIDDDGNVSDEGRNFIVLIEKREAIYKGKLSRLNIDVDQQLALYMPKKFRGKT